MGVRVGSLGTGKSPAFRDSIFIEKCQEFFLYQLEIQKPKAIFVLGKYTALFLSSTANNEQLKCWDKIKHFESIDKIKKQVIKNVLFKNGVISNLVLLTHPSFRNLNFHRREFEGKTKGEAEINMIKAVL